MIRFLNIFFLLIITFNIYSDETITLAIGDWEPYTSSRDENGKIAEKIVLEAFKLVNIDVTFEYFPWQRSMVYVKEGVYPATFPWYKTEERELHFYINTEPIITVRTVFFHLKSLNFDWNDYDDLFNYRIGGTIGYAQTKLLEEFGLPIDYVGLEDLNYKKLLGGRIDLYPNSMLVGYSQIALIFNDSEATLFTHHPKSIIEDFDMYMLFSKKNTDSEELAAKFDKGLRELKASGRYDEILAEILNL